MLLIGLTGGIACGKSTVSKTLEERYQLTVIDADRVVRDLQRPSMPCTLKIAKRWPKCVNPQTGEIDRAALGHIIFRDPQARREISRIMRIPIFVSITTSLFSLWWQSLRRRMRGEAPLLVVLDVPLLYESKTYTWFIDAAVVVGCSEEQQIARLERRNGLTSEQAMQRIRAQMPIDEKCKLADHVIRNDGSLDELRCSIDDCVEWMRRRTAMRMNVIVCTTIGGVTACLAAVVHLVSRLLS